MPRSTPLLAALALSTLVSWGGSRRAHAQHLLTPGTIVVLDGSEQMAAPLTAGTSRWEASVDALLASVHARPEMNFAVVVVRDGDWDGIAPAWMTYQERVAALQGLRMEAPRGASMPAESLRALYHGWLKLPSEAEPHFEGGPWALDCHEYQMVFLSGPDLPLGDTSQRIGPGRLEPDVRCGEGRDVCMLDNALAWLAGQDVVSSLAGNQLLRSSVVMVGQGTGYELLANAAHVGGGAFVPIDEARELTLALRLAVEQGFAGALSPARVHATRDLLLSSHYESAPLMDRGHLRAWRIQDDPSASDYGEVVAGSGPEGSLWDAGELLAHRPVVAGELNQYPGHDNGLARQIWTHFEPRFGAPLDPFDRQGVANGLARVMLPGTGPVNDCPESVGALCSDWASYDWNGDGHVDAADAQRMVDFLRGVEDATWFGTDLPRGNWRLGASPVSEPVLASARPPILSDAGDFVAFLEDLSERPSMVYLPAQDGMLHAFGVNDRESRDSSAGVEWWAYVPRSTVAWDSQLRNIPASSHLTQLPARGSNLAHDASCSLDYVWIDGVFNGIASVNEATEDGIRAANGSEWHRILVCSMGRTSPVTYALMVTDPVNPRFMWEHWDDSLSSGGGQGLATGRPVLTHVIDRDESGVVSRRPVVFRAGGLPRAGEPGAQVDGRAALDTRVLSMIDVVDPERLEHIAASAPATGNHNPALPPEFIAQRDQDVFLEYVAGDADDPLAGVAGTPSLVDVDADGQIDVAYIGARSGHLYKVLLDDLRRPTVCEFASPGEARWSQPEQGIYLQPSVAWDEAGALRVFAGTGAPWLHPGEGPGRVSGWVDPDPTGCVRGRPSSCLEGGELALAAGEHLVGAPLTAEGAVYFATWQATPGCPDEPGVSRLYGLSIATCEGVLPDPDADDATATVSSIEIEGRISNIDYVDRMFFASVTGETGVEPLPPIKPRVGPLGLQDLGGINFDTWRGE